MKTNHHSHHRSPHSLRNFLLAISVIALSSSPTCILYSHGFSTTVVARTTGSGRQRRRKINTKLHVSFPEYYRDPELEEDWRNLRHAADNIARKVGGDALNSIGDTLKEAARASPQPSLYEQNQQQYYQQHPYRDGQQQQQQQQRPSQSQSYPYSSYEQQYENTQYNHFGQPSSPGQATATASAADNIYGQASQQPYSQYSTYEPQQQQPPQQPSNNYASQAATTAGVYPQTPFSNNSRRRNSYSGTAATASATGMYGNNHYNGHPSSSYSSYTQSQTSAAAAAAGGPSTAYPNSNSNFYDDGFVNPDVGGSSSSSFFGNHNHHNQRAKRRSKKRRNTYRHGVSEPAVQVNDFTGNMGTSVAVVAAVNEGFRVLKQQEASTTSNLLGTKDLELGKTLSQGKSTEYVNGKESRVVQATFEVLGKDTNGLAFVVSCENQVISLEMEVNGQNYIFVNGPPDPGPPAGSGHTHFAEYYDYHEEEGDAYNNNHRKADYTYHHDSTVDPSATRPFTTPRERNGEEVVAEVLDDHHPSTTSSTNTNNAASRPYSYTDNNRNSRGGVIMDAEIVD